MTDQIYKSCKSTQEQLARDDLGYDVKQEIEEDERVRERARAWISIKESADVGHGVVAK